MYHNLKVVTFKMSKTRANVKSKATFEEISTSSSEEEDLETINPKKMQFTPFSTNQQEALVDCKGVLDDEVFFEFISSFLMNCEVDEKYAWKAKNVNGFFKLSGKGVNVLKAVGPVNFPNALITVACDSIMLAWYRKCTGVELRPMSTQLLEQVVGNDYLNRMARKKRLETYEECIDLCRSLLNRTVSPALRDLKKADKFAVDVSHEISLAYKVPMARLIQPRLVETQVSYMRCNVSYMIFVPLYSFVFFLSLFFCIPSFFISILYSISSLSFRLKVNMFLINRLGTLQNHPYTVCSPSLLR